MDGPNVDITPPNKITVEGLGTGEISSSSQDGANLLVKLPDPNNRSQTIFCYLYGLTLANGNVVFTDVAGSKDCHLGGNLIKGGDTVAKQIKRARSMPNEFSDSNGSSQSGGMANR